jgi:hypothetical protein
MMNALDAFVNRQPASARGYRRGDTSKNRCAPWEKKEPYRAKEFQLVN